MTGGQGKDRKISQEEIEQFIPDFPKRSNQEGRDAALLAWDYAGFPIRLSLKRVANKKALNEILTRF